VTYNLLSWTLNQLGELPALPDPCWLQEVGPPRMRKKRKERNEGREEWAKREGKRGNGHPQFAIIN